MALLDRVGRLLPMLDRLTRTNRGLIYSLVLFLYIVDLYVLDARDTSILLVRYGYIDEATSLTLLYGQDLDIIFDSLVDKYLAALTTEQESLTSKNRSSESSWASANKHRSASALLSLQNYLDRYDNAESNYRYRLEVVERILSRNGDFNLQPWLTLHYLVCVCCIVRLFGKLRAGANDMD